jgi:hypothetical protein
VHIGTDEPIGNEELWIDTDEEGMNVYTQQQIDNINNAHKPWLTSGHTGTANKIAGFDALGATKEYSTNELEPLLIESNQSTGIVDLLPNSMKILTTTFTNTHTITITPTIPTEFTNISDAEVYFSVGASLPSITISAPSGVTFVPWTALPTVWVINTKYKFMFIWHSETRCDIEWRKV